MASYHFSVQVVSRGAGRSAVACAAYRAGARLTCERDGLVHDYSRKQGVLHSEITLPDPAPERWLDRSTLWNEVEASERRADAQLARETVFAVPHELSRDEQVEFCREAVRELFVADGMVADWSLHDADSDGHNVHCHVMTTLRSCDEDSFLAKSVNVYTVRNADGDERKATGNEYRELKDDGWEKVYKYRLGNEYRELTPSEAQAWDGCKRIGRNAVQEARYLNDWNDPRNVGRWREKFCAIQNRALERAGSDERVDHRSYEARGIERVAQRHEGPHVRAIEREAERQAAAQGREYEPVTYRAAENAEVRECNALAERIEQLAAAMGRQLAQALRDGAARVKDDLSQRLAEEQRAWRERIDGARQRMASMLRLPTRAEQREQALAYAGQADRRLEAYRQRLMDPAMRLKASVERLGTCDEHRDLTRREKSFLTPEQLARHERTRAAEVKRAEQAREVSKAVNARPMDQQHSIQSHQAPAMDYRQSQSRGMSR